MKRHAFIELQDFEMGKRGGVGKRIGNFHNIDYCHASIQNGIEGNIFTTDFHKIQ